MKPFWNAFNVVLYVFNVMSKYRKDKALEENCNIYAYMEGCVQSCPPKSVWAGWIMETVSIFGI